MQLIRSILGRDDRPAGGERRRFQRDVAWNLVGFVLLGVAGIALNVLIARIYGAATLGAFNQVVGAYIVTAMLATAGIHVSALRAMVETRHERAANEAAALGAFLPALLLALLATLAFLVAAEPLSMLLDSPAVLSGMRAVAPGLFFFALNKTLFGILNGLRRMRAFASFHALRYLLVLAAFLVVAAQDLPGERLPVVFSVAEALLFPVLLLDVSRDVRWWRGRAPWAWSQRHLSFGLKNFMSGVLLELNSRVDVLMLGLFLGDTEVGVYSFAALFAEGFYQLFVVLQNNYNPLLAAQLVEGRRAEVTAVVRRGRKVAWAIGLAAGCAAILVFPLLVTHLTTDPAFSASGRPFVILIVGLVLAAGYLPFHGFLAMANLPGWHSVFMALVVLVNVIGNACAIPLLGIEGAALATGASLCVSILLLRLMALRLTGVRL